MSGRYLLLVTQISNLNGDVSGLKSHLDFNDLDSIFYDKNQRLQHNQLNIIRGFLENFKEDFGNTVLRPQIKWVELKGHRNHPRGKVIQSDYPWKTVSI